VVQGVAVIDVLMKAAQINRLAADLSTMHIDPVFVVGFSVHRMVGEEKAVNKARLTRTVWAKDEGERLDGHTLSFSECFEVAEMESG
jgi:hypothetical protein